MIEIELKNGTTLVLWNGETMDEDALRKFIGPNGGMKGGIDWKQYRTSVSCHNCGEKWVEMSMLERTYPSTHPDTPAPSKHGACPACEAFQW